MRMKQILSISLAAAAALTLLSGCGMGGTTQTGQNGKTTILVGGWPTPQRPEELETYNKMREDFMKKYPDIDLQVEEWNYSIDTFLPKAASGQLPSNFSANFTEVQRLTDSGYVSDITNQMQSFGYADNMKQEILNFVSKDGRIYGVPTSAYTMGLEVNRRLFEQAGLTDESGNPKMPGTFEELAETAKTIKEKTGQAGFIMPTMNNQGGWHFMNIAWAFGVEFMKQEGEKWKAAFDSEECVQAFQYLSDLKWKYNALSDNILIDGNEAAKMLASDRGGMFFGTPSESALRQLVVTNGMDKNNLGLGVIPAGPKGKYALMGGWINFLKEGLSEAEKDAIFKWLDFKGQSYSLTEETRYNMEQQYKANADAGNVVGVATYQIWKSGDRMEYENEMREKYANVDLSHFEEFNQFEGITIKPEEPVNCQELYTTLDDIIQKILGDPNADIKGLVSKAAADFQTNYLDRVDSAE